MSLVHEALQKAEQEKHRKAGITAAPVCAPKPVSQPAPATKPASAPLPAKSHQPVLWALTICVALVAVVAIVWMMTSRGKDTIVQTERIVEKAPVSSVAPTTEPPAIDPAAAAFKLTGIVVMPDGVTTAVINGKTVYETHFVDGAIVKKIERDRVTLDLAGRDVVLRLF